MSAPAPDPTSNLRPAPEPTPKRDRTTLPAIAVLIGVALSAYGFRSESDLLRWILPAGLVAAAVIWVLLPQRGGGDRDPAR